MASRVRKPKINTTAEVFAAASNQKHASSTSQIVHQREYQEEEESENEATVSETLQHQIPTTIESYEIRGTVGEGAFSVVKLAYHKLTRQYYACKVIERVRLKRNNLEHRFECEIRVHQQMHHHGIIDLFDILEDEHFYYVFLEFCPSGELFQYIVDNGRLQEDKAKPIMKQILEAVKYIHDNGVSHRDLKPENLLLDQFGRTKISDFGLSRFLGKNGLVDTPCGSPCYASPECISGSSYDGRTSDCWSVGVIFYAMVTGQLPWTKRNQTQLFEQIRKGEYTIPCYLTAQCRDLIAGLMCVNSKKRLTAAQALEHPFLRNVVVPLQNGVQNDLSVISLKHVDAFFGLCDSTIDVTLPRMASMTAPDYDKVVKSIMGPQPRQRASRRKVAVNRQSTANPKPRIVVKTATGGKTGEKTPRRTGNK